MNPVDITIYALIGVTAFISYRGFQNFSAIQRMLFDVGQIIGNKDYVRLVTSGFIHADWTHLLFNMLTLYFFAPSVAHMVGIPLFLGIYAASLIIGNLFALAIHRNEPMYKALGASGAVSGVVFAAIALFPGMKIMLFMLPIPMPAWIYGLGYVLYSIYGIRTRTDNIGHDAHLGGGIAGLLTVLIFYPQLLMINTLPIALILVPSIAFILVLKYRPDLLNIH